MAKIVVQYGVSGVQVHDAQLAAAIYAHGIREILTLNGSDFTRFAGITNIDPTMLIDRMSRPQAGAY